MKTRILKLTTGDEIVVKCELNEDQYNLKKPMLVTLSNFNGQLNVTLSNWIYGSQITEFSIKKDHVLLDLDPNDVIEKQYLSVISGIKL